jgi:hypothetical protein
MAVIVIAEVPGQTQEGFDGLISMGLGEALRQAPGFVLVTGFPTNGTWQTIEVWETTKDAAQFFAKFVKPNLPAGLEPKRTMHELSTLVTEHGVMLGGTLQETK